MSDPTSIPESVALPEPIASIEISGFKSIRHQTIELQSLNVLIGPNGAGKSNFLGLFKLLRQIVERSLKVHVAEGGYAAKFLHRGRQRTRSVTIDLKIRGGVNWYGCELSPNRDGYLFFQREWCGYSGSYGYRLHDSTNPREVDLGHGHSESAIHGQEERFPGGIASRVRSTLSGFRIFHFHDTSPSSGLKQAVPINDNAFLREDGSNLPAFLFRLRQAETSAYKRIVEAVQRVASFFDDFCLAPTALNPTQIRLEWKARSSDDYFDAASLSDGTLRFICLATLLLQPSLPSVVLIDEPELGLHPSAIVLLTELLRSASTRSQIIVSTQSTTLVNQLRPEEVIVVESQDGASTFRRLTSEGLADWLGDYGLGDLWEKNLLGGRP